MNIRYAAKELTWRVDKLVLDSGHRQLDNGRVLRALGFCRQGSDVGLGWGEVKVKEPLAGDVVAIHFGGCEIPAAGRLQCGIGKEAAGSGGGKFGVRYVA